MSNDDHGYKHVKSIKNIKRRFIIIQSSDLANTICFKKVIVTYMFTNVLDFSLKNNQIYISLGDNMIY